MISLNILDRQGNQALLTVKEIITIDGVAYAPSSQNDPSDLEIRVQQLEQAVVALLGERKLQPQVESSSVESVLQ